jgi:hypothetical protein
MPHHTTTSLSPVASVRLASLACVAALATTGRTEPDPAADLEVTLDGQKVTVPQGTVKPNPAMKGSSSYSQSEYLVYNEEQVRIRYVVRMKFETSGGSWH